ncbi:hypothetical protein L1987_67132 [Smallanthus sonchifolius]|uniref:Uncharacterized protein n=1 Tax=Smallanthus sonchifolius TaxID=185202 RepID=A0ACB9BZ73_9ASTR|nr:hypothetical protein L1987_67132 [Smallanthus sonchifolius]
MESYSSSHLLNHSISQEFLLMNSKGSKWCDLQRIFRSADQNPISKIPFFIFEGPIAILVILLRDNSICVLDFEGA